MRWRGLASLRLESTSFVAMNCAFGPLAALLSFKPAIADAFGVSPGAISLLYGAYFLAGGVTGRWLALRGILLPFRRATIAAALALAAGSLFCAWIAPGFLSFAVAFVVIVATCGGTWFISPLAGHVIGRTVLRPATGLAMSTVGQLTAFGAWKFLFALAGITDWRVAMTMAAGLVVVAIPLLAVGMDVPMSRPGIAMPMGRGGAPPGRDHFPPLGFGLIAFSGTVLILGLGAPAGPAGGAYGYEAFSCAAIIGRLTAASFFDRGWRVAAILCCSGLVVAASVAPVLAGSGASLAVGAVCLGLGYGGFLPLAVTFARERRPAGRERVSAGMFHASCVGIAVGAALPLLADHAPPSVMPGLVVAATVAAFVLWFLVVSQRR